MKTRTRKGGAKKKTENETSATPSLPTLSPSASNPPQVFVLPRDVSADARIVHFPDPATDTLSRYLLCPERGCYDFTRVAAGKRACRSWLLAPSRTSSASSEIVKGDSNVEDDALVDDDDGYVLQQPDLMIATPMDTLFLILPALAEDSEGSAKQMYLSAADYLDRLEERSAHFRDLMRQDTFRSKLEGRFEVRVAAVCDVMEVGDETLYRLSHAKLLAEVVAKARRMVARGLPRSMEEQFVRQALAVPVASVQREESSISVTNTAESQDSSAVTSQESSGSTVTQASTNATSISVTSTADANAAPSEISDLLRLRTALDFLLTSYIPAPLRSKLTRLLAEPNAPIDFAPLNVHQAHLTALKKEAQALRSMSDNISRKRGVLDEDDDEAMEKAAAKKRKKEEEEMRKKNASRGVQMLKKADTSGMKKLSSFFAKKS